MALLGWTYRLDRARLLRALHGVVTAAPWPEMRVRIDVLAGPTTGATADSPTGLASRELIALQPFTPPPPELYETGVAVAFAEGLARERPLVKTADFAEQRPVGGGLRALEVEAGDTSATTDHQPLPAAYEYLLLSPDGRILEGAGTNFWGVRDGVVYTAGEGVLEGITREILMQLIPGLGIPLRLEAVAVADIPALDEAALSGSSRAFLPVVSIAGQTVGDGRPGPLSRRILAAYNAFVAENVATAV